MLIALSVIVIILGFTLVPFVIAVNISGDIFAGKGNMKLTLFGLPVFKAKLSVESNGALEKNLIIESGKKRDEIHLNADKSDDKSIMAFFHTLPIMSYIIIERLELDVNIGLKNNAFVTTMAVGFLRTLMCAFTSFLRSRQNIDITQRITPQYNSDRMDFAAFGIIKLSIAHIIIRFIAGLKTKLGIASGRVGKRYAKYKTIKVKKEQV